MPKQLKNLEESLVALKQKLARTTFFIDKVIKEIREVNELKKKCPICYGRDIRVLINNRLFCKSCGYKGEFR